MKKYFQVPWNIKQTVLILAITTGLVITATAVSFSLKITDEIKNENLRLIYIFMLFIVQWILILGPLFLITAYKHSNTFKNYGIKGIGIAKTTTFVIFGYLKYLGIIAVASMIILFFELKIPGFQTQENIIPLFGNDTASIITAGIIAVICAPIVEEIFFRGFLLRSLINKWGIVYGNILTAGLFSIFHMQWQTIIPIFILGMIINGIAIRSGSIIPTIAFHIFNNAVAFTFSILMMKEVIQIEKLIR